MIADEFMQETKNNMGVIIRMFSDFEAESKENVRQLKALIENTFPKIRNL